jgi:fructose-1,6-bisphosphatase/inositol monophosphatase family enzyme
MPSVDRPTRFIETLLPAFEQAAAIATALEGRVSNRPKSAEASEVKAALTIADTAAQEAILVPLIDGFADCRLEAEEDTPSVERFSGGDPRQRIVIDPIDGTFRFYLGGAGPYAIMAGWALDRAFLAALVALPTERALFVAVAGAGAREAALPVPDGALTTRPVACPPDAGARRIFVSDTTSPALQEALRGHGFEPHLACGGAISVAPLLSGVTAGLRFANDSSTQGISIRGRVGALIAREAGAHLSKVDGTEFPLSIDEPADSLLVARSSATAEAVREAIRMG